MAVDYEAVLADLLAVCKKHNVVLVGDQVNYDDCQLAIISVEELKQKRWPYAVLSDSPLEGEATVRYGFRKHSFMITNRMRPAPNQQCVLGVGDLKPEDVPGVKSGESEQ
jgi:hypothetical protein